MGSRSTRTDTTATPTLFASARTVSSISRSMSAGLNSFPTAVVGSDDEILTRFGTAARSGMVRAACSISSSSVTVEARLQLNVGDRQLAGVGVRASDRGNHRDRRMVRQSVLDDPRIDVVPSPDDQLLLASGQPEVAVGVASAEIAGIEPAFAVDIDPEALVVARVEVALEDVRPADRDDADLVCLGHSVKAPVAAQHDGGHSLVRDRQADRARTSLACGRITDETQAASVRP